MSNKSIPHKRDDNGSPIFGDCPKCGTRLECVDSRPSVDSRRRRWKCPKGYCTVRISTREITDDRWNELKDVERNYLSLLAQVARFVR